jgi:hypothetical protein
MKPDDVVTCVVVAAIAIVASTIVICAAVCRIKEMRFENERKSLPITENTGVSNPLWSVTTTKEYSKKKDSWDDMLSFAASYWDVQYAEECPIKYHPEHLSLVLSEHNVAHCLFTDGDSYHMTIDATHEDNLKNYIEELKDNPADSNNYVTYLTNEQVGDVLQYILKGYRSTSGEYHLQYFLL